MSTRTAVSLFAMAGMLTLLTATSMDPGVAPPPDPQGPTAAVAHCDAIAETSACVEYGARAEADAECGSLGGKVADGACPTDNLAGACQNQGQLRRYYTSGGAPTDAAFARRHCENALVGKFVP